MSTLDKRLHAYRPDLADLQLQGRVTADLFVAGRLMQVVPPVLSMRREPRFDAVQISEMLMGDKIKVFDEREGWSFAQRLRDGYVGYVSAGDLSGDIIEPTHRISVPSTLIYPAPSLKSQPAQWVTLNAEVTVTGGDAKFARIADGRFIFAAHLRPVAEPAGDFVNVAETMLHAPYYWGGKSVHGLDCSGLVQLSLEACGLACPRDSDMQEAELGSAVLVNDRENLKRGDLMFWDGHVGIIRDPETLLHANGHHMLTVAEPLAEAVARIAATGKDVTSIRRL